MTLERRTPLRAQPRSKGNRAERAIVDLLHAHGWRSARRNWQSGGQGGGDIIEGPADVHLEVKHREVTALWEWIEQALDESRPTDLPVVVFRCNGQPWWAALPYDELLALHGLSGQTCSTVIRHQQTTHIWRWTELAQAACPAEGVPVVVLRRNDVMWWAVAPFLHVLTLLWKRELAP